MLTTLIQNWTIRDWEFKDACVVLRERQESPVSDPAISVFSDGDKKTWSEVKVEQLVLGGWFYGVKLKAHFL